MLSEPQLAAYDYRGARGDIFRSALPGGLKLLALALVEFMPYCRPSVATLAAHCGVERKTVLRALGKLELLGVVAIERSAGERSRYQLRGADCWRIPGPGQRGRASTTDGPVPHHGTGSEPVTESAPVPARGTGDAAGPVPTGARTGTNGAPGPVPTAPPPSPIAEGPKAEEAVSESGVKRGARAAFDAVARTLTMPGPAPTQSYLAACVMAGVTPAQAASTWSHYFGAGLPPGGVERLDAWLVQRAKERQVQLATLPRSAAPARPGDDLDTTGAATVFRPNSDHERFAKTHLPKHNLQQLAQKCRQVPRFAALDTEAQSREFMARLKCLRATGIFFPDGPLPQPKGATS